MKNYFEHIGLCKEEYPVKHETYTPTIDVEMAGKFLQYLSELNAHQLSRSQTIESKNSQLLGQSSIVVSIVALFIPLFVSNFSNINFWLRAVVMLCFLVIVFHYILTIYHSAKPLEIDKNRYMGGATSTVTKDNRAQTEIDFMNEEIADLVNMVNRNTATNNKIASNLVYASRCFKIGNFGLLGFILLLVMSSLAVKDSPQRIEVVNLNEIATKQRGILQTNIDKLNIRVDGNEKRLKSVQIALDTLASKSSQ